ncbi:hypothetical protein Golax_019682, partial [Gossypium laxum]|nr:hypothetical protein [Gossypium davidsonii]MBA0707653.1 hypothetical protein [Gossypium laxum]
MSFTILKPWIHCSYLQPTKFGNYPSSSSTRLFNNGCQQIDEGNKSKRRGAFVKVNALPDWPLMAVLVHHVQQLDAQREIITNKSIWHLSDEAIKKVCKCFSINSFIHSNWSMIYVLKLYDEMLKNFPLDPYYDSEVYRKDGGDGTGHWVYEK